MLYLLGTLGVTIYAFWAGVETRFKGANDDSLPLLLVGLYFIIFLQMFSGLLGFIVAKIIRKLGLGPRRPSVSLVPPREEDDPKFWT